MDHETFLASEMTPPPIHPASVPAASSAGFAANNDRTGVFTSLVKEDGDISGLVAYSIYKQNKLDWLQAFEAAKGRAPDDAEVAAYIIGESTPRRLATYRHLADSTLAGRGPDLDKAASPYATGTTKGRQTGALEPRSLAIYAVAAILFLIAFWAAAHYTLSTR